MPSSMPPRPLYGDGAEQMQQWLQAKSEEDRRIQEEEKTRQETLKLEQRRIEQAMLVESLRAGVPTHLVPLILAGMSGGGSSHLTLDLFQQYVSQPSRGVPVQTHPPPNSPLPGLPTTLPSLTQRPPELESQRDVRSRTPNLYAPSIRHAPPTGGTNPSHPLAGAGGSSSATAGNPTSGAPIPRLMGMHTNSQTASFGSAQHKGVSQQQQQQSTPTQRDSRPRRSPPTISFHHWVPPGQSQSQAPPNKGLQQPVLPSNVSSNIRSEQQGSPSRKRKSSSIHQQVAPPSSRSSEQVTRNSPSGRQSPSQSSTYEATLNRPQRQHSDRSSSQGSRATEGDFSDELSSSRAAVASTEPSRGRARERSHRRSIRIEQEHRSPDREVRAQPPPHSHIVSDAENVSDPSQDTGMSTRSGGTAGRGEKF